MHPPKAVCPSCKVHIPIDPESVILGDGYSGVICGTCCLFVQITNSVDNRVGFPEVFEFNVGDTVLISNSDHVWNGEAAEVHARKGCFYRVQIRDALTWVPSHWLEKTP